MYKIIRNILIILMYCLMLTGCHRKTQIYIKDDVEISETEEISNNDIDYIKEKAIEEELERIENAPSFTNSAEKIKSFYTERGYKVIIDEWKGEDGYKFYNIISNEEFVTIQIDASSMEDIKSIDFMVNVKNKEEIIKNEIIKNEFLTTMKDLFEVLNVNYVEKDLLQFIEYECEPVSEVVIFDDRLSMYSQYYLDQYYITITPISDSSKQGEL